MTQESQPKHQEGYHFAEDESYIKIFYSTRYVAVFPRANRAEAEICLVALKGNKGDSGQKPGLSRL